MQLISQHDSAGLSTRASALVPLCFINAIKSQCFRQCVWLLSLLYDVQVLQTDVCGEQEDTAAQ